LKEAFPKHKKPISNFIRQDVGAPANVLMRGGRRIPVLAKAILPVSKTVFRRGNEVSTKEKRQLAVRIIKSPRSFADIRQPVILL